MLEPCSKLLSWELGKSAFKIELRCFCLKKLRLPARNIDRAQTDMGAPTPKGLHQSAYLPQFKSRLFYSMYRFQKLVKKMSFNVIPPQVQSNHTPSVLCRISNMFFFHDQGHGRSWVVPPKL